MEKDMELQFITPKEMQKMLKIGRNKVNKLCSMKGFPAIKFGSTYRINKSKLFVWLEDNEGLKVYLR